MFRYTKGEVIAIARDNNFLTNNTEKVMRLSRILNFLSKTDYGKQLVLKGGTAINLFLLDLPRLSVDIDFDFSVNCSKSEMLKIRENISKNIMAFMTNEGYQLSDKSRFVHTLDSFIYSYYTVSGSSDVLKIEINYSDRLHVLPIVLDKKKIFFGETIFAMRLSDAELIGSKINALIVRTTPRDIYDAYNLFKKGIDNITLVKKIAIFYVVLGSDIPVDFNKIFNDCISNIELVNYNKLRDTLIPVLHKNEKIDIEELKSFVINKLKEIFVLDEMERKYIEQFNLGVFDQKLLFGNSVGADLGSHPMVIWKTSNKL